MLSKNSVVCKSKTEKNKNTKPNTRMAFEDRCCSPSPPPGIPHSPQNGRSFTTGQERSMSVSSIEHSERTSPSMLRVSVKEEHNGNDGNQHTPTPISFSITNILSNSFGNKIASRKITSERKSSLFRPYDVEERRNESRCVSRQRSDDGDDDEEDEEIVVADPEPMPKFTNGAIDFSSNGTRNGVPSHQQLPQQQQSQPHPLMTSHSLHPNAPIYSSFYSHNQYPTLANNIYPRLHEEILNSQKKYQQYYQTTQMLSDSVLSKYPPLGNLCKTVSQIGQSSPVAAVTPINNKITSPLAALSASQKKFNGRESVESTSTVASQSNNSVSTGGASKETNSVAATTRTPQSNSLDSGMESSDDTKSESGSTKDENGSQLWPAWIYCTRYSDRPSSGKHRNSIFFSSFASSKANMHQVTPNRM